MLWFIINQECLYANVKHIPPDNTPIANNQNVNGLEDTSVTFILNVSDPNGDSLEVVLQSEPLNGQLAINGLEITYIPFPNYNGIDVFVYSVYDGFYESNAAEVVFQIESQDDAPIAENIDFESTNHNLNALNKYTSLACVDADIQQFPNQYDTLIGERGVILSGGQKSRLALTRALYKPHALIILDDVLSAVDHDTEQQLIQNLIHSPNKATRIIISHRISALTQCQHIIILDKGKIIDQGTHQDLIQKEGIYKHTWAYQRMNPDE